MAKSKFAAARQAIRQSNLEKDLERINVPAPSQTAKEIQRIAYENRYTPDADGATMMLRQNARDELFTQNLRWVDVREVHTNPDNYFDINPDEIELLISLILTTGYTASIIVREILDEDGNKIMQLVDGERRLTAHMYMGAHIDPMWYIVSARYYPLGTLSDEEAKVILSALNLGQRHTSESNRATAMATVKETMVEKRLEEDPDASKESIDEQLARMFNMSPRQASMNANIGAHLVDAGLAMLDKKQITKAAADVIATLPENTQIKLLNDIATGAVLKKDAETVARDLSKARKSKRPKAAKSVDGCVNSALKSLRSASRLGGPAQRRDIAALRDLIDQLDPDLRAG